MKHSYSKLLVSLSLSAAPLLLVIACDSGSTVDGASSLQDALKLGDADGDGVLSAGERDVLSSKCHARGEPSHELHDAAAEDDEADALDDEADEADDEADDTVTTAGAAEGEDNTESDADGEDHEGETEDRDAVDDDASDHERFHAVCTELFADDDDDDEEDESDDAHGGSHRD